MRNTRAASVGGLRHISDYGHGDKNNKTNAPFGRNESRHLLAKPNGHKRSTHHLWSRDDEHQRFDSRPYDSDLNVTRPGHNGGTAQKFNQSIYSSGGVNSSMISTTKV